MNSLDANTRNTKSKGDVRWLLEVGWRHPWHIVYGGKGSKSKSYCIKKNIQNL